MEFERTEDGQIQAAFARRVGKVLLQYEAAARNFAPEDQHEATLCICLLQAVLTQCTQAMRRNGGVLRDALNAVLNVKLKDQPPQFGLDEDCIQVWGHTGSPPAYRDLIEVIRNALSHPTPQSDEGHPTTGYITVLDDTKLIQNFRFVASPWVNGAGKQKGFPAKDQAEKIKRAQELVPADQRAMLECRERCGNYYLELNGKPFVPHTIVTLSVRQIRTLTLELSDLLGADPEPESGSLQGRKAQGTVALSASLIAREARNGRG